MLKFLKIWLAVAGFIAAIGLFAYGLAILVMTFPATGFPMLFLFIVILFANGGRQ
jgi:hypothetical protein